MLTYYLFIGMLVSSTFMNLDPFLDLILSKTERTALYATAFLMWPLIIAIFIIESLTK